MNLSAIRDEAEQELQDTANEIWPVAELNAYINDGVLLIQRLTEWYEDTANIVPIAGTEDYSLPSNNLVLRRVTWDEKFLPQTTHFELDRDNPTWREAGNNDPIRFFIPQWDTLSSYPKPLRAGTSYSFDAETGTIIRIEDGGVTDTDVTFDAEVGIVIAVEDSLGGQIRFTSDTVTDPFTLTSAELGVLIGLSVDELNFALYFSALPDTLSADTDVPQNHQCTHPALVSYTCFRAFQREGPHQNMEAAMLYWEDFADWMEVVLRIRGRQFPDEVFKMKGTDSRAMFESRLSSIGPPVMADLLPSYPSYQ